MWISFLFLLSFAQRTFLQTIFSKEWKEPNGPYMNNPCLDQMKKEPFCDITLPLQDRVTDILGKMSIDEKINALGTRTDAIASLGLNAYNWWSEATHGISHVRNDKTTPAETNFALPVTTAGSFNRTMWRLTGRAIGMEARAFMNAGNAYSTYWAPVINLIRDPRWGRNIETPGEDPYLSGQYAIEFVKGMEENPMDPRYIQASACCKHYVANSMEETKDSNGDYKRQNFDAKVTPQDLVDSYMAPFQDCVEQGKVSGLMCSYNAVNGVPSCASGWMTETVARGQWGFEGYMTSDCDADYNVFNDHHYKATKEEVVQSVLEAGTDVDCGSFVPQNAKSALQKGLIDEKLIDARLRNLFTVRMRLGHFDPAGPLQQLGPDNICTAEAQELARDGVRQGSVLLKNLNGSLPWQSNADEVIAVIGPNGNLSETIAGYYGQKSVCGGQFTNAIDAIAQYGKVVHLAGVPSVTSGDTSGIAEAVTMAQKADKVVLVVGNDLQVEREGHDRTDVKMSDAQNSLVQQVAAAAAGKPVVVVILTGGAIDSSAMMADPNVDAVLHAGQPSVQVLGVGDLIFGKAVPAGRMIQTSYPNDFADAVSIFDMNMRPGPSEYNRPREDSKGVNPGRTHRFYTGTPVAPFGFGLSYSTFTYKVVRAPRRLSLDPVRAFLQTHKGRYMIPKHQALVEYTVQVTNTGNWDADDVVLGFLTPPGAGKAGVPLQTLFGFERVFVPKGQTVTVSLAAGMQDFAQVDEEGKYRVWAGRYAVKFGVKETAKLGMGYAVHLMDTI